MGLSISTQLHRPEPYAQKIHPLSGRLASYKLIYILRRETNFALRLRLLSRFIGISLTYHYVTS